MMWTVLGVLVLAGAAAWGPIVSNVEQAKYTVVEQYDGIEIRDYERMIVAGVEVSGERKEAINKGFRMIADYIFGNNVSSQKVAMTAPVIQQASEKIAMTAPVIQQADDAGVWKVRFVMPSAYTLETLPRPVNDAVRLEVIPARRFAVIRFSGIANDGRLEEEQGILEGFVVQQGLTPVSQPVYAFFNPPWTLPFLRRNEVMIEVGK